MRGSGGWRLLALPTVAVCAIAVSMTGPGALASAARAGAAARGSAATAAAGPVSPTPVPGTPHLAKTGADQIVRQLVQCGSTMYAVGRFTEIESNGHTLARNNIFSFSAAAPFTVTSWNPDVNGEVNSIAFNGTDCSDAYIGGQFTSVGGSSADNIAKISTSTGAVIPAFGHDASNIVDTLVVTPNGHLLAGGHFGTVNGTKTDKYLASLNLTTGADDGFLHLKIHGQYHFCNSSGKCNAIFPTQVYNQQLSHSGTLDLAEGVFTKVGGLPRQQIFMLNLATDPATVTGWTSPEWDGSKGNLPGGYPYQCNWNESFYVRGAAWSPSDSTVYIADTGFHPWNLSRSVPRSGLCDALAAFPATQKPVTHKWINYTGCYSLYTVAADRSAVYAAGHPKFSGNPRGCKFGGPGSTPDAGLEGVSPRTGAVLRNRAGTAGRYSMARANADDMLITGAGLWIASTDRGGDSKCGGAGYHGGICFLPYP